MNSEPGDRGRLRSVRRLCKTCTAICLAPLLAHAASNLAQQIQEKEWSGDLSGARTLLDDAGSTPEAAEQTARFLDRHADPMRRNAYLKWAAVETDGQRKLIALKQAVLIDVQEGRQSDLTADLELYRRAGGSDLTPSGRQALARPYTTVEIPGPLSSFARMAALSPDLSSEDLLPSLARNLTTNGFETSGNEVLQQTEYLKLLVRYVGQARELQALATGDRKIVIPACDSEQTGTLLKILGYRMRGSCGSDLVLETVNPTRAFLTIDSGFPLTQLEQDLRANHKFELPYAPTTVPVLYDAAYWMSAANTGNGDFLDAFMSEPALCRLYLGLSHVDYRVAEVLRKQMAPAKLRLYANVLDFFGGMLSIDNGSVVVPGPAKAWSSIVGTSPSNAGPFLEKILTSDDGWMMSYYDTLMRMSDGPVYRYLTQADHLRRFYDALRGKITTPGPARPVFRSSTDLVLFTTSLYPDADGAPHIPGNVEIWRNLFIKHPHGKYDGKLTKSAAGWKERDDVLEALFAMSRKNADNEPLHIFLALNDVDRGRTTPVKPEFAARLVAAYSQFGPQYELFASNPILSERSMSAYLDACQANMKDVSIRPDRMGSLQAAVELWRILVRQGSIPASAQDKTFGDVVHAFEDVSTSTEVYDAGRNSLKILLQAVSPQPEGTTLQEKWVNLLAGEIRSDENQPPSPGALFVRYFDAQDLVPIDALFAAADRAGKGSLDPKLTKIYSERLDRLNESSAMHDAMSRDERTAMAMGYWTEHHLEVERKFSLDTYAKDGKDVRAALAPFLRDTMVGLLYCYYAPAGSQVMLTNPMFVRMHDFIGVPGSPEVWRTTEVANVGWPANAGGRLAGSLIRLPYALAQAEQNFLMPRKEQALIWSDMVPQLIMNVTVTRWRDVTPEQIRWVSLNIRRGQNLIAAAAVSPSVEAPVLGSLSRFLNPANIEHIEDELHGQRPDRALNELPPSYLYALAIDPKLAKVSPDVTSTEIAALTATGTSTISAEAIARAFGTPKPSLTHSLKPQLMYLRTFPTLMGFSSRLMAESWESNNLFYAALADQAGIRASELDAYVPEWNRSAIENIFATHLEDWPALIRSLNVTADSVLHRNNQQADIANSGNL